MQDQEQILTHPDYPDIAYSASEGKFYRLKNKQLLRELFPSESGQYWVVTSSGKKTNRKAEILAMEFITKQEVKPDESVLFKNFDKSDLRAFNLLLLPKEEYKSIKDAIDNLEGAVKTKPDKNNPYGIVLLYKKDGRLVQRLFNDVVTAKKQKRQVLLEATKLLSKYILTT